MHLGGLYLPAMADEITPVVRTELPTAGLPTPSAANFFHFSHHGGDVEMLVGYIDLYNLATQVEKARSKAGKNLIVLRPELSSRIQISVRTFLLLRGQVEQMFQKLQAADVIERVEVPATEGSAGE